MPAIYKAMGTAAENNGNSTFSYKNGEIEITATTSKKPDSLTRKEVERIVRNTMNENDAILILERDDLPSFKSEEKLIRYLDSVKEKFYGPTKK